MRKIRTATTIALGSLMVAVLPGWCGAIEYSSPTTGQPGKFAGEIPLSKLNGLLLPDGTATFDGDKLTISAVPDWLFDRDAVLIGAIVRAEYASQDSGGVVAGLVYFYNGQWLPNLASRNAADEIELLDGRKVQGRVFAKTDDAFAFRPDAGGQMKIAFSDIKSINSPRAYKFNIPVPSTRISADSPNLSFDANQIALTPATLKGRMLLAQHATLPTSNLPGTESGVSKNAIATFIGLDIVNDITPAIVIPLVLSPWTQAAAKNRIREVNIQSQLAGPGAAL